MSNSKPALVVIDLQNDYFPGGAFPLWQPEAVLERTLAAVAAARAQGVPVILVQHVADPAKGPAPFFNQGTPGVDIHPRLLAAAPEAPVVLKRFADSFHQTDLEAVLVQQGITELWLCGMMTHNCVTHTALSKAAEKYPVSVLKDCCTTVSEMMHRIALSALTTRVAVVDTATLL
jgi:nicotinamidase-related amidase